MKRILFLALFALLVIDSQGFATQITATFGNQNSSGVYRMAADDSGVVTFAQDTGIVYPYTTATTTYTLTAAQTGTTTVFTGTSNKTRFNLPAATVGLEYAFINDTTNAMVVYPNGTDTINFASLAASAGLTDTTSTAKGDSVTLFCAVAGKWSVSNMRNTWVSIAP